MLLGTERRASPGIPTGAQASSLDRNALRGLRKRTEAKEESREGQEWAGDRETQRGLEGKLERGRGEPYPSCSEEDTN